MKLQCPCCRVSWQDNAPPLDLDSHALCAFCSANPSSADLLDYQMANLELIKPEDYPRIMRAAYRLMRDLLDEKIEKACRRDPFE